MATPKHQPGQKLPTQINIDDYYSIKEVCSLFGITQRTLHNWRQNKKIEWLSHEVHVLFEKAYIDKLADRYGRMGFL